MIHLESLAKSFNGKHILKDINLEIYDNETMVILGSSGQGKTVLIKAMNRLIEPDSGKIVYGDTDITQLNKKSYNEFRKQIGFVFQNSALFDFLTVQENLSLFLTMHMRIKYKELRDRIDGALAFVGLGRDILNKYPDELSGGMRKRVAIARTMIIRPKYIFYDEPTTGLDKINSEKVSELINMLKTEINATSIIVTHDIELTRAVADRVALLKHGEFTFVGTIDQISPDDLENVYNGVENEL